MCKEFRKTTTNALFTPAPVLYGNNHKDKFWEKDRDPTSQRIFIPWPSVCRVNLAKTTTGMQQSNSTLTFKHLFWFVISNTFYMFDFVLIFISFPWILCVTMFFFYFCLVWCNLCIHHQRAKGRKTQTSHWLWSYINTCKHLLKMASMSQQNKPQHRFLIHRKYFCLVPLM